MNYAEQRAALLADLKGKLVRDDMHGVSDAANDIRVLDAVEAERKRLTADFDPSLAGSRWMRRQECGHISSYNGTASGLQRCVAPRGHTGPHGFR